MFTELTPLEYLQCEIACKADKAYEKATWNNRIAYFKTLDLEDKKLIKEASNPIGLKAAILAYSDAVADKPIGYMISLDACSSGLQILSLLTSCIKSFNLCGGNPDSCESAYTILYNSMGVGEKLTAKQVKNAIMTALYGSTAMPEATFGDNIDVFYETMAIMAPGAWDLNIGLQDLWTMFNTSDYAWVLPDNFHAYIETKTTELVPFSFLDKAYKFPRKVDGRPEFHKGLGPNLIHSIDGMIVREMYRRCSYDSKTITRIKDLLFIGPAGFKSWGKKDGKSAEMVKTLWNHYKTTGFLSVRILDYLYEDTIALVDTVIIDELVRTLPKQPFEMVSVHDCFRVHPNYGNDLRRQYQYILADLNDSTLLKSLCSQVAGRKLNIKKTGQLTRQTILASNYCLA